jgi:WD40 repeat protein
MSSNYLAFASGKSIDIHDAETNELIKTITSPAAKHIQAICCANNLIAVAAFKVGDRSHCPALVFDVDTMQLMGEFGDEDGVRTVCFNYAGNRLLTRNFGGNMSVWELSGKQRLFTLYMESGQLVWPRACFSFDDQRIICSNEKKENCSIVIADANTGDKRMLLEGHSSSIRSISVSPDGFSIASSSNDCTVIIWNMLHGTCRHRFSVPTVAEAVCYFPDGSKFAYATRNEVHVRCSNTHAEFTRLPLEYTSGVFSLAVSPQGNLIAWTSESPHRPQSRKCVHDLDSTITSFSAEMSAGVGVCCYSQPLVILM